MKKNLVLFVLFVLPIVAYLFFASGITNFGKLPVLTEKVADLDLASEGASFAEHITILGFLGRSPEKNSGNAFNLNQKIYKRFSDFNDFQFVMLVPKGSEVAIRDLKKELGRISDVEKWKFVFAGEDRIRQVFKSLGTRLELGAGLDTPYVFIIDKDGSLRGRTDDEEEGLKYGFDSASVADLNNKMVDDVKIVLAEYRMALKKNHAQRN